MFNFFELLRFRTFSNWIEGNINTKDLNQFIFYAVFKPLKLMANTLFVMVWPLVAFYRHALFQFKYEASDNDKAHDFHTSVKLAKTIASRTQIIEICTEASLQVNMYIFVYNVVCYVLLGNGP